MGRTFLFRFLICFIFLIAAAISRMVSKTIKRTIKISIVGIGLHTLTVCIEVPLLLVKARLSFKVLLDRVKVRLEFVEVPLYFVKARLCNA